MSLPERQRRDRSKLRPMGMKVSPTEEREDAGVRHVECFFRDELRWLFRVQRRFDYGIDAHAEIVNLDFPETLVTGRLLAVQVKSGDSFFDEPDSERGWRFRDSNDHLAYWLGGSLPTVVVLVNSRREAYWEVISTRTVTENADRFSLVVPRSHPLDATAAEALISLARRADGVSEQFPRHLAVLSPGVVELLQRIETVDQLGAARLAEYLAGGRRAPALTADAMISAEPSWLIGSPIADAMWRAVGVYASDHNCFSLAAEAFLRAAELEGPDMTRDVVQAGLLLLASDREEARAQLVRARELGQVLLADIGLSQLEVPVDDGKPFPVPASVQNAGSEQLAAEPIAMMFLAENANRSGRVDEAIEFAERAVAAAHLRDTRTRLELAKLHHRRALMTDMAPAEFRRALVFASEVVEERRRWDGPSSEALALQLDILIATDMEAAVEAALPDCEGGRARQTEVADPEIARRGAFAALAVDRADAYRAFLTRLPDGPNQRELGVLEGEATSRPPTERIDGYRRVLDESADPGMAVRVVAALVRLGVWPPEADDLHQRAVLPDETYRILTACYQARSGDRVLGIARLREMANRSAHAAHELVVVIEELEGPERAIEEAEKQSTVWPAAGLALQLLDLYGKNGREDQAAGMIERRIGDDGWPSAVRMNLANWYIGHTADKGLYDQAMAFAARAMQFGDSPALTWSYIKVIFLKGDVVAARTALARHRPDPVGAEEMKLFIQLHFGVELTVDDAQVLIEIAHGLPDGALREVAVGMLVREVLLAPPQPGTRHSDQAKLDVGRLQEQIRNRPGGMLRLAAGDDATLREAMAPDQPDPAEYQKIATEVGQGRRAVAEIARFVAAPYATAIIRRPGGVVPAIDLSPGVRAAGRAAAGEALKSGRCVADLSSLHLLTLLGDDDRLRIITSLRRMLIARSSVTDATMTRERFREIDLSSYTAAILKDGTVQRSTLSLEQKQYLRESALALELIASQTESAHPSIRTDAPADTLALAEEQSEPLWCDDIALRQQARQRGVRAFSIIDLFDALEGNAGAGRPFSGDARPRRPLRRGSSVRRLAHHCAGPRQLLGCRSRIAALTANRMVAASCASGATHVARDRDSCCGPLARGALHGHASGVVRLRQRCAR